MISNLWSIRMHALFISLLIVSTAFCNRAKQTASISAQASSANASAEILSASISTPALYDKQATVLHTANPSNRQLRFNQKTLSAEELRTLEQVEARLGFRLPDGDYWYDSACGAAGRWGGPVLGSLPPGLSLGGKLPVRLMLRLRAAGCWSAGSASPLPASMARAPAAF